MVEPKLTREEVEESYQEYLKGDKIRPHIKNLYDIGFLKYIDEGE